MRVYVRQIVIKEVYVDGAENLNEDERYDYIDKKVHNYDVIERKNVWEDVLDWSEKYSDIANTNLSSVSGSFI